MLTACFTCKQVATIGEMYGMAGLPSMDVAPRGDGDHRLSKLLTAGWSAEEDETFGYIYSGLAAIGVFTHAFDQYKYFLETHAGHRLFQWNDEDERQLPADLRDQAETLPELTEYEFPSAGTYAMARLQFRCEECADSFCSPSADAVRPFKPRVVSPEAIATFRQRTAQSAEMNVHEAEPFNILFMDLDDWLAKHEKHPILLELLLEQPEP